MLRLEGIHRAVEAVDRELARLAAHASVDEAARLHDLRMSWARLVDLLALGMPADASVGRPAGTGPP